MALDHANYFIAQQHSSGEYWGGQLPVYADGWQFMTRWITHLSAPGFFLLMGVGMALYAHNHQCLGETRRKITLYFIIRGLVLITVQLLLVNRLWEFSPGGWGVEWYFGTLWALGGSMLICSMLVWQDTPSLLGLAGSMFIVAEILTPNQAMWGQKFTFLESILLVPAGQIGYWVNYPVLQWVELVIFGLVVGKWIAVEGLTIPVRKRLLRYGVLMLAAFVGLRLVNGFGNIQLRVGDSWLDFLNVVKYPPSMTFTLLTTGILLLLMTLFAVVKADRLAALTKPLLIYGKEPLFFYVQHLIVYASMSPLFTPGGTSLRFMVFFWLFGLVQLLIPCTIYSLIKRKAKGVLREVLRYL